MSHCRLTAQEFVRAENYSLRLSQKSSFMEDLELLKNSVILPSQSKLMSLESIKGTAHNTGRTCSRAHQAIRQGSKFSIASMETKWRHKCSAIYGNHRLIAKRDESLWARQKEKLNNSVIRIVSIKEVKSGYFSTFDMLINFDQLTPIFKHMLRMLYF